MKQQLQNAIKAWQAQCTADEERTAGMIKTAVYTPSDALYDALRHEAVTLPLAPKLAEVFGKWLAEPVICGDFARDNREVTNELYRLVLPHAHEEMAAAVAAHNALNVKAA